MREYYLRWRVVRQVSRLRTGAGFALQTRGVTMHTHLRFLALAAVTATWITAAGAQQVRYFPLPSGAGPHDVAPAPDGTVWYTAQRAGALGRLDPRSGEAEQIPLGRNSAPHGVIVGPDGAAWVTDGGLNAIVRVDPVTEAVKVLPLPAKPGY